MQKVKSTVCLQEKKIVLHVNTLMLLRLKLMDGKLHRYGSYISNVAKYIANTTTQTMYVMQLHKQ